MSTDERAGRLVLLLCALDVIAADLDELSRPPVHPAVLAMLDQGQAHAADLRRAIADELFPPPQPEG